MGSVGGPFYNAMVESFFAALECELIDRSVCENRNQAVFACVEGFDDSWRRHGPIDNLWPNDYASRSRASALSRSAA